MSKTLPHKLKRALQVPTIREREEARKASGLAKMPTFVEDAKALDHIGSCLPNVMKQTPPQDTYLQKIMNYPASHKQARRGQQEEWEFDGPQ